MEKMQLIKTHRNPQCLAAAVAMVTGTTLPEVFAYLGHDGTEIWNPAAEGHNRFRGFTPIECIDYAYTKGFALVEWPLVYNWISGDIVRPIWKTEQEFLQRIVGCGTAILMGYGAEAPHAVAFSGIEIYDPRGKIYPYFEKSANQFENVHTAFLVRKIAF